MRNPQLRLMFRDRWPLLAIVLFSATLGLLCLKSVQIGQPADDANYLILAESLATGHGLRLICLPSAPLEQWFPAGWPMLLAPIVLLSHKNYELTRYLSFAFSLVSVIAVYMIGRLYWRREIYIASTLLFAVAPVIVLGAGSPMSEPAYIAFSLFAVVVTERLSSERSVNWLKLLTASLLIAAAIYIRTIGITLLVASVIYLLLRHKQKPALTLLLMTLLALIPQFILNISAGGAILSPKYQGAISGSIAERLSHILQNLGAYVTDIIPSLLVPVFGPQVDHLLNEHGLGWAGITLRIAIVSAVGIGLIWSLRKIRLYHIYSVLFFAATLLYYNPISGSTLPRYLIPILPFLLAFLLIGADLAAKALAYNMRASIKKPRITLFIVVILTATIALISIGRNIQQGVVSPLRDRMTDVSAGGAWIKAHTPSSAIVAMPNPIPRYIYAQRKVMWFPNATSHEVFFDWLDTERVTYLLIGPPLRPNLDTSLDDYQLTYVVPLISQHPERFRLEYADDRWNVKIYSVQ